VRLGKAAGMIAVLLPCWALVCLALPWLGLKRPDLVLFLIVSFAIVAAILIQFGKLFQPGLMQLFGAKPPREPKSNFVAEFKAGVLTALVAAVTFAVLASVLYFVQEWYTDT